ncbi:MAG TPA: ATP-binding protein [Candidatus Saccharimonadales bacterium]|jgi:two-component system sensor histidine kinase ResE|nr:ATP-binding protein [Candidatus Saccharimonadales bacterium]
MALKLKKTKASSEQLDHSRLTSLINSMADAVIAVDERVRIVLHNGAALNILDSNTIHEGERLGKLFKPIDKDNQPVDVEKLVLAATTPRTNRDLRLKYDDGSVINLYISIAPVHLGYGEEGQRGFVLLLRDITHEKSLEEERDEFISVVSHELRTPIAISEGNISNAQLIAEKSGETAQIRQALEEAHNQILYLSDMINDLSTLSRAERGSLNVEIEAINVHDLLTELAANYLPDAKKKGLNIKIELDPKLELLQSGRLYVREVLQNFITNAIKYTQRGHITIGARAKEKGVEFYVSDTGIGINKGDQERVFDKFFRSEDYRTRQNNGTGLGLYVTLKLARLIHADIRLKSKLNHGSTFTIYIPNLQ